MPYMDPDLYQRLTLLNQYTILAAVDPASKEMWDAAAEAVRSNWPVDDLPEVEWMIESARDPITEDDRTRIHDIMTLYEYLQYAEGEGVGVPKDGGSLFPGFDGNGETSLMSYARDMVKRRKLYTYLKLANSDLNSHHPTHGLYDRMLAEYETRGKPYPLSAEDYDAIIAAQIHPYHKD